MTDVEAILARATPPQKTVRVCLAGQLVAEMEEVADQLADLQHPADSRLNSAPGVGALAARLEDLRTRAEADTVEVTLQGLPRTPWRELVAAHPPRREADGSVNPADKMTGVDESSFYEAMIKACWVTPALSDDTMTLLLGKVTDRQFQSLGDAAWAVNRREVSVPLSRPGWPTVTSAST